MTLAAALVALLVALATSAARAESPAVREAAAHDAPERSGLPIGGRLLATGGATQLEGAAGGGLVPWAVLAGYGTEGQVGASAHYTRVGVQDFHVDAFGAAFSAWNRLEVSIARQSLAIEPLDETIDQLTVGAKVRLLGDLVYTDWPTLALGVQYKRNLDFELPRAVGARDAQGVDVYLAASKLFLDGVLGVPLLVNGTLRATRANQLGLLGFGGDESGDYEPVFEGSVALLLSRRVAVGYEYRQKPDNLSFAREGPWQDAFVAVFVSKNVALVGAYAWLDDVALWDHQSGFYLSLQAGF